MAIAAGLMPPPTDASSSTPGFLSGITPYKLTIDQYMRISEKQILTDNDRRFELLDGIIVETMTKGAPHDFVVSQLGEVFRLVLPSHMSIREEKTLTLGEYWCPEPDLIVVFGRNSEFRQRHPIGGEVAMIIEVSDSTYLKDRGGKWIGYAGARLPVYWIVRLETGSVEVYTDPCGKEETAYYQNMTTYSIGESVPIQIGGRDIASIPVEEILA